MPDRPPSHPPADSDGSVSAWIRPLQGGDPDAADHLWQRYFARLVDLARHRLGGATVPTADEEDVALSAFKSFCDRAGRGLFPNLHDRDNLWSLLAQMTANKAADAVTGERRQKRGGRFTRADDRLPGVADPGPPPDLLAQTADECRRMLDRLDALGDPALRRIALLKLEGHTNDEVAAHLGTVGRTVQRKLQVIRRALAEDGP